MVLPESSSPVSIPVVVDGILMVERFVVRSCEFLQSRRGTQRGKFALLLFCALRSQSIFAGTPVRIGTLCRVALTCCFALSDVSDIFRDRVAH